MCICNFYVLEAAIKLLDILLIFCTCENKILIEVAIFFSFVQVFGSLPAVWPSETYDTSHQKELFDSRNVDKLFQ